MEKIGLNNLKLSDNSYTEEFHSKIAIILWICEHDTVKQAI